MKNKYTKLQEQIDDGTKVLEYINNLREQYN